MVSGHVNAPPHIVVAGAGTIGCFIGGLLLASGAQVTFLGRTRILDELSAHGLHLTDFAGLSARVKSQKLEVTTDPAILACADLILITVKSAATESIGADIAQHGREATPIVSLQNGLDNAATLHRLCKGRDIRAGMVPFNVVPMGKGRFHRATSGDIVIEDGAAKLAKTLSLPDLNVSQSAQIEAIQWGKFLLNLNNAPNALSGLPLQQQLMDVGWRRLMADQMIEALGVLRAHDIAVKPTTPVPAGLIPYVLRLPTPLFRRVAASMLTIDPTARTSMAYDLMQSRPTEVDVLQGKIIALAEEKGMTAPICTKILRAVKHAELAGLSSLSVDDLGP